MTCAERLGSASAAEGAVWFALRALISLPGQMGVPQVLAMVR